jgi:hypothetical protein
MGRLQHFGWGAIGAFQPGEGVFIVKAFHKPDKEIVAKGRTETEAWQNACRMAEGMGLLPADDT